jgi:acetoacetyl-CoA synthetase
VNRHGVLRHGRDLPWPRWCPVEDALVVNLDLPGGPSSCRSRQAARRAALDEGIERSIRDRLRTTYSPRHVPDRIIQVAAIPYTLTGKKLEVPVRRILSGVPEERAANRAAMADPAALDFFIEYARTQRDYVS